MKTRTKVQHRDSALITALGGDASLARTLGFSIQRVHNWNSRGIPPAVRLDYPDVFRAEPSREVAA